MVFGLFEGLDRSSMRKKLGCRPRQAREEGNSSRAHPESALSLGIFRYSWQLSARFRG